SKKTFQLRGYCGGIVIAQPERNGLSPSLPLRQLPFQVKPIQATAAPDSPGSSCDDLLALKSGPERRQNRVEGRNQSNENAPISPLVTLAPDVGLPETAKTPDHVVPHAPDRATFGQVLRAELRIAIEPRQHIRDVGIDIVANGMSEKRSLPTCEASGRVNALA